jgi:hypothetical protein
MELAIIIGIVVVAGGISTALFIRRLRSPAGGCSCQGQSTCSRRAACSEADTPDQQA